MSGWVSTYVTHTNESVLSSQVIEWATGCFGFINVIRENVFFKWSRSVFECIIVVLVVVIVGFNLFYNDYKSHDLSY